MLTASSLFLKTLSDVGITHAFVNWGSDHPALLEDLERQRQESSDGESSLVVVTCPNEMVALSAAQGFAQVAGRPAAVIVHVDVGTQAMAGAIHNVNRSRTPVLIYAGASPFSSDNEHKGTRNEWIMWIQDIPDQTAIVRQYMRFTSQFNSAKTIPQVVKRSLQIATSDPKGPVYLWARRETMEEEIPSSLLESSTAGSRGWSSVEPTGLSPKSIDMLSSALLHSTAPLILTSHLGRNPSSISKLVTLSKMLAIPIVPVCPSTTNAPTSHPFTFGPTFLFPGTHTPFLQNADVVLVIECDLPWIPANDHPPESARVFVIDAGDPLKTNVAMGMWHVDAEMLCSADAGTALTQLVDAIQQLDADSPRSIIHGPKVKERAQRLRDERIAWLDSLDEVEASVSPGGVYTVPQVVASMRNAVYTLTPSKGENALILNESISNFVPVWSHLLPERPGNVISSGGSSLGWGLGAAVGASLAKTDHDFVALVVGDGSFLFGVPSSAYWMARKYNTPFLTVILNNGGWHSPKLSMMGVHPHGMGSLASGDRLTVGFGPECPDYLGIAVAASNGWAWGARVDGGDRKELDRVMQEAVRVVLEEGRCAVLDCVIESI
ncbi:thiamine diphosphate-binding protein [Cyathus striatus]|nr:thiamine diphosphate-binding protein [Cyathus striatus]